MADLHSSAVVKTGQVVILASSSGSAKTTTTGTVVDITLQPNTIATIFGVFIPFLSFF
jgi:predicted permease